MECNRDEALRAKEIAERKFNAKDIAGAKKFALKAQNLFPSLEGITQMIATFDVYLASEMKVNGEGDWYSILCLDASADEETIKKQYRKLAFQLHPDKIKSIGSEGAFKLISEAWSVLSDKSRKMMYDQKRNVKGFQQKVSEPNRDHSVPNSSNGLYSFANNTKSNTRARKSTSHVAQSAAPPSHPSKLDTFWTSCNQCRMQYEYLRVYLNHNLLCPNCHQAFLAVETGVPIHGPNSSISCSTKRHQQKSNHNSSMKNAYGCGNNSTFPGTGHPGFHHGGNLDSYSNTNFQWGSYASSAGVACSTDSAAWSADMIHQSFERIRRKYEETQATIRREEAPQSKRYVSNSTFNGSVSYDVSASGNAYEQERPASKVGRPAKRRRSNSGDTGHGRDGTEQMATGTGKTVASELEMANGVYGDYGKTRVTARQNNFSREYTQVGIRSILMEKAKAAIHRKLEEWNLDAAAKLAEKETTKQKQYQKDKDNENVADRVDGVAADKTQSNDPRIGKKQIPGINKDSPNDHHVDSDKEATQPTSIDVPDPDFNDLNTLLSEASLQGAGISSAQTGDMGNDSNLELVKKAYLKKKKPARPSAPRNVDVPRVESPSGQDVGAGASPPRATSPEPAKRQRTSGPGSSSAPGQVFAGASSVGPWSPDEWSVIKRSFDDFLRPVDLGPAIGDDEQRHGQDAVITLIRTSQSLIGVFKMHDQQRAELTRHLAIAEAQCHHAETRLRLVEEDNTRVICTLKAEVEAMKMELEAARASIANLKEHLPRVTQEAVELYRSSIECRDEKVAFAQPLFGQAIEDCQRRVLKRYPGLDLGFLEEESEEETEIEAGGITEPGRQGPDEGGNAGGSDV